VRALGAAFALAIAVVVGARAEEPPAAAREGQFTARWVVTGTWRGLGLGPTREGILADLSGRLDVTPGGAGPIVDLASRCLVLWDSAKGGSALCRWRHPSGDEIFGEVEGDLLAGGKPVTGRFVGGTGRYAGITGEFRFDKWDGFFLDREERPDAGEGVGRAISGFTNHLAGTWRLPPR
jgi:hypothetical protein